LFCDTSKIDPWCGSPRSKHNHTRYNPELFIEIFKSNFTHFELNIP